MIYSSCGYTVHIYITCKVDYDITASLYDLKLPLSKDASFQRLINLLDSILQSLIALTEAQNKSADLCGKQ